MLNFPFFCPACRQVVDAKADPVGLLFGGRPDFKVKCTNCDAQFKADVDVRLGAVVVKDRLEDAEGDDDTD